VQFNVCVTVHGGPLLLLLVKVSPLFCFLVVFVIIPVTRAFFFSLNIILVVGWHHSNRYLLFLFLLSVFFSSVGFIYYLKQIIIITIIIVILSLLWWFFVCVIVCCVLYSYSPSSCCGVVVSRVNLCLLFVCVAVCSSYGLVGGEAGMTQFQMHCNPSIGRKAQMKTTVKVSQGSRRAVESCVQARYF
jgi:hypothetical protein